MSKKVLIVEDQFIEANYLSSLLKRAGYAVCGIARSVAIAREMIDKETPELVILDIFLSGKLNGIDLAKELKAKYIAFIYLSANSNEEVLAAAKLTEPCGFLVKPFREKELLITLEISAYRHEHSMEVTLRKEEVLRQQLSAPVNPSLSMQQQLLEVLKTIQPFIPFDFAALTAVAKPNQQQFENGFLRIGFEEYQYIGLQELQTITKKSREQLFALVAAAADNTTPSSFSGSDFEEQITHSAFENLLAHTFNLRSLLRLPLKLAQDRLYCLWLFSKQPAIYTPRHISCFGRIAQVFNSTIDGILNQGRAARDKTSNNSHNTQTAVSIKGFDGIIGTNHLLLNIFDQITQVAPTETSVFILGESGTGKEGVANCIHHLSSRRDRQLVKVNCGALPPTLIESELFGHEKGSFTGASERKIGKFELADKGTIFLDEIGELPPELQVKLLRALQEKEIERVGGKMPVKVDIRIIAATNRNLEKEIAEGRFRLDLYYRLFVFPIVLPPLRERLDDLPALAHHFINLYNQKTGRRITGISDRALQSMMEYEWPGNIRELEHLIERSVLLTKSNIIDNIAVPFRLAKAELGFLSNRAVKTIHENERDHIMAILKQCKGKIWGAGGAASLLNIPPSTLKSRMIKLGIKKDFIT